MQMPIPTLWAEQVEKGLEYCGFIPGFLDANDPRPAREQLHANYAHGGGWHPFEGFTFNEKEMTLEYPGDPAMRPFACCYLPLTDETVIVFEHAWVAIVQGDNKVEIARMD
jgi:hypothetical protein